uniref:VWFA domain-containing protein n=1 Tax=Panagrellus redivivus TaxID=6233 RepID=A0A7E4VWU3_PANRE
MRVLSRLLALICIVSSILAYETPGLEVVVLIKATSGSVDSTYFSSEIVPLINTISKELIFPEDVSAKQREFARISVSVGGTSDDWPAVPLRNQSRSEFLTSLTKLNLAEGNANVGNVGAIEFAVKTLYDSSVSLTRLVLLLTDEVLTSDSESDDSKRLSAITGNLISIIGIPSIQNPSFNDSIPAAIKLAGQSYGVFESISEALSRPTYSITNITSIFMQSASRICRRILFLYENSGYVDPVSQKDFIEAVNETVKYFRSNDVIALASFDDLLSDRLVFILAGELTKWIVKPSNTYNISHGGSVYDKLVEISQTPDFLYLDIVLLAQADVFPHNTTNSMFNLADQHNVNIFVYDDSQNPTSSNLIFQILTKNRATRIFSVFRNNASMATIYADNIYPTLANQDCNNLVSPSPTTSGGSVPTAAVPSNGSPTPGVSIQTPTIPPNASPTSGGSVPTTVTTSFDSTTTQAGQATTTSAGNGVEPSFFVIIFVALIVLILV